MTCFVVARSYPLDRKLATTIVAAAKADTISKQYAHELLRCITQDCVEFEYWMGMPLTTPDHPFVWMLREYIHTGGTAPASYVNMCRTVGRLISAKERAAIDIILSSPQVFSSAEIASFAYYAARMNDVATLTTLVSRHNAIIDVNVLFMNNMTPAILQSLFDLVELRGNLSRQMTQPAGVLLRSEMDNEYGPPHDINVDLFLRYAHLAEWYEDDYGPKDYTTYDDTFPDTSTIKEYVIAVRVYGGPINDHITLRPRPPPGDPTYLRTALIDGQFSRVCVILHTSPPSRNFSLRRDNTTPEDDLHNTTCSFLVCRCKGPCRCLSDDMSLLLRAAQLPWAPSRHALFVSFSAHFIIRALVIAWTIAPDTAPIPDLQHELFETIRQITDIEPRGDVRRSDAIDALCVRSRQYIETYGLAT